MIEGSRVGLVVRRAGITMVAAVIAVGGIWVAGAWADGSDAEAPRGPADELAELRNLGLTTEDPADVGLYGHDPSQEPEEVGDPGDPIYVDLVIDAEDERSAARSPSLRFWH